MVAGRRQLRDGILSTDADQLTMTQVYWRHGLHDRRVRFEHFFRSYPDYGTHQAGYCVAAGLGPFARWVTATRASPAEVDALGTHRSSTGEPLFDDDFCAGRAPLGTHAHFDRWTRSESLLETIVDRGDVVVDGGSDGLDDVDAAAARRQRDVDALDPGVRRLVNPHEYHVSITTAVRDEKRRLLEALR